MMSRLLPLIVVALAASGVTVPATKSRTTVETLGVTMTTLSNSTPLASAPKRAVPAPRLMPNT